MAVAGDTSAFDDCFPDGLVSDILDMLLVAWDRMPKPARSTIETRLTRKFGFFVRQEKSKRELPFRVHVEHSLTDDATFEEAGRIDLCLQPGSHSEELYFAFEAKRLRVPYAKSVSSNAPAYVGAAGMGCFISGQYAEGLPHGGMIGYVMDGKLTSAKTAVQNRITGEAKILELANAAGLIPSRHHPGESRLAESLHRPSSTRLVLHHVFLPI